MMQHILIVEVETKNNNFALQSLQYDNMPCFPLPLRTALYVIVSFHVNCDGLVLVQWFPTLVLGTPRVCWFSFQPINAALIDSNCSFSHMHLTALKHRM